MLGFAELALAALGRASMNATVYGNPVGGQALADVCDELVMIGRPVRSRG